ncbi:glycosyltransferase [Panacibacter ginsenosidivorans]|uniref:Glycosyltransferase n=1 Tax=Panacibacter ginsenosidivorans TaxID=1813871 RepID=A0A5B8VAV9_9BACT|nr:glycosyltransferase [Panacibacter ginsenosidivorans]QEC68021.1 glycosyltransferase [Panacibacter ginsenosidivorans]
MPHAEISIVIATYNGEKHIKAQLGSILHQINDNTEVVISDNGSTDNTVQMINAFNDPRIKLLQNLEKKGSTNNFEFGLQHTTGNIIFLADQDDIWLENKFNTCLEKLKQYDLVVTNCKVVDDQLNVLYPSFFELNNSGKGIVRNLKKNAYLGCCLAFKREVLNISMPFPQGIEIYPMHDIWIGFVADCFFSTYFIDTPLLLYRRHQNNISTASNKSPFSFTRKLNFRWRIVKYFPLILSRYWKVKFGKKKN